MHSDFDSFSLSTLCAHSERVVYLFMCCCMMWQCDVFNYAEGTFQLYEDWMGQEAVADKFLPFRIYVHVGVNYANAFFRPNSGLLGFGDGHSTWFPLTVPDVTAHEIAHGFTNKGSDLVYKGESGSINEGMCMEWSTG